MTDRPATEAPAAATRVPAVTAAIAILRHLAGRPAASGVTAIARATDLSPSSCLNILRTLAAESFVDFDPTSKAYTLGTGPITLARRALDPSGALDEARAGLEALARREGVTTSLWRRTADRLVLLGFAESGAATSIHLTVGQRLPVYLGAMGRSVAAHENLSGDAVAAILSELRWHNPPAPDVYRDEVAAARVRGWSVDEDRFMQGVTTLAAPVLDEAGRVRLCVSSTLFTGQMSPAALERLGGETGALATALGRRLFGASV